MRKELLPTIQLALPMIYAQLLGYSQAVVDTVMAGRHNSLTLAAVSLASQLFALIYLLFNGIAIGFAAQFSRYNGADDRSNLRFCFHQGLFIFTAIAVLCAFLIYLAAFLPPFFGTKPEIARECKNYLLILAIPAGVLMFASIGSAFLQGMAYPRSVNILMTALLPVNILGNWIFLSFTDLEAAGMAIATGICYLLYAIVLFTILAKSPKWKIYHLFRAPFIFDRRACLRFLLLGLPIGIAIVLEAGLFSFIGIMASRETAEITSANQIAVNFISIIFMVPLGISSALTIRVAHAFGQKNYQAVKNRAIGGLLLSAGFMSFAALMNFLLRQEIAAIYTADAVIIVLAAKIMLVACVFQILDGVQVASSGILRGLADTAILMRFAIFGYWIVGLPVGLIFAYGLNYGILGLWIGCALGLGIFAVLALGRVFKQINKLASVSNSSF